MGRLLRTACFGWLIGFSVVLAGGGLGNRPGNPGLSAAMLAAGAASAVIVVLLVLASPLSELISSVRHRRIQRVSARSPETSLLRPAHVGKDGGPDPTADVEPADAGRARLPTGADGEAAAARIAALEARLAIEEEQLRSAAEALAATDALAASNAETARRIAEIDTSAGDDEPALRRELLDAVATLIASDREAGSGDAEHKVKRPLEDAG